MAISSGVCTSYKAECMQGIHSSTDAYKLALYTSSAAIGPDTTAYTAAGEASGLGYVAGGTTMSGFLATRSGNTATLDFANTTWPTITTIARGALIYNSSKGNRAVAVLDFGQDVGASNGPLTVVNPVTGATTSLVRWA